MEYFNNLENDNNNMSLIDTIDSMTSEERHQLDLFLNSDRQDCAMDINLKTETNCGLPDFDQLDTNTDYSSLNWLQSNGLGNFSEESESENTDPNLLVNPQTVIPVDIFVNSSNGSGNSTLSSINSSIAQISSQNNIQIVTVTAPGIDVTSNLMNNNTVRYQTVNFTTQNNQPHLTKTIMSPSLSSPVLVGHLQNSVVPQSRSVISLPAVQSAIEQGQEDELKKQEKVFPKPVYSYSCLIALALKNSDSGNLPVSDIYTFMIENYPYFKTAPDGWKNSVRHNLSLNKCFQKADIQKNANNAKKGCLWALNPAKVEKMEEEIVKWRQKDPQTLHHSMAHPERLELIESGKAGIGTSKSNGNAKANSLHTPITVSIPDTTVHSLTIQHPSTPKRHLGTPNRLPSTPNHHQLTPTRHQSTPTHHPSTPTHHPSTPTHHPSTPTHHPSTHSHQHSDVFMTDLHDINLNSQFGDPALSELASGLWDDDINCDLGLELTNPPLCITTVSSPMGSCNSPIPHQPSTPSAGYFDERSGYHGTYFYTSPVQLGSPSNIPNTFLYATPSPRTLFA